MKPFFITQRLSSAIHTEIFSFIGKPIKQSTGIHLEAILNQLFMESLQTEEIYRVPTIKISESRNSLQIDFSLGGEEVELRIGEPDPWP